MLRAVTHTAQGIHAPSLGTAAGMGRRVGKGCAEESHIKGTWLSLTWMAATRSQTEVQQVGEKEWRVSVGGRNVKAS